jgi:hypothetical protein
MCQLIVFFNILYYDFEACSEAEYVLSIKQKETVRETTNILEKCIMFTARYMFWHTAPSSGFI